MIKKDFFSNIFQLFIIVSLSLGACSTREPQISNLKITVLPILETLPIYVAQHEGLFEKHAVQIELISVASGAERDQLISAGQADGMINEALSTALYNQDETRVQIVRFARQATKDQALFRILTSSKSGITDSSGLKNVEIGISEGTVIEYLTDRLLEAEGFTSEEIQMVAVPKIPDRLALLNTGELKAAMLPEPLSSLAELQGAKMVLDDTIKPEYSFSVISFRKQVCDQNPQAIEGFLAAFEEAVVKINQDPNQWLGLLVEHKLIPEPLVDTYQVPTYTTAGIPTQAQWDDVISWGIEKGILKTEIPYSSSVTNQFLP
jgi:NitT/TauT family transport system substrate-binding protein